MTERAWSIERDKPFSAKKASELSRKKEFKRFQSI